MQIANILISANNNVISIEKAAIKATKTIKNFGGI